MHITEENMTPKEMLERIAELDHSHNQLRDLNAEMHQWLDVADDEMTVLRVENTALRKQVKALEQIISDVQQVEAEPCREFLADEHNAKKCSKEKMQKLEEDSMLMSEENKKLTAELRSLQEQKERDKISLSKLNVALSTLEFLQIGMEEAQSSLQQRDEVIEQKKMQLKQAEETVEEFSDIIQDLRLANQELRTRLEDRQDEASFAILSDIMAKEREGSPPPLSLAEEIQLLVSSAEIVSAHPRHEETEAEEFPECVQGVSCSPQASRCEGTLQVAAKKVGLFFLCIFIFTSLAFVASGLFVGQPVFLSFDTLWRRARLMLQPYCGVQYRGLPPI